MENDSVKTYPVPISSLREKDCWKRLCRECMDALGGLYPDDVPLEVYKRLIAELDGIAAAGTAEVFTVLRDMKESSRIPAGEMIFTSDISGLYVSYLLGLTETDPLREHTDPGISSLTDGGRVPSLGIRLSERALEKAEGFFGSIGAENGTSNTRARVTLKHFVLLDMLSEADESVKRFPEEFYRADVSMTDVRDSFRKECPPDCVNPAFEKHLKLITGKDGTLSDCIAQHFTEYGRLSGHLMWAYLSGRTVCDLEDISALLREAGAGDKQVQKVLRTVRDSSSVSKKTAKALRKRGLSWEDITGFRYMSRITGRGESASFFLVCIRLAAMYSADPGRFFRTYMEKFASWKTLLYLKLLEGGEVESAILLSDRLTADPEERFGIFILRDAAERFLREDTDEALQGILSPDVAGYLAGMAAENDEALRNEAARRLEGLGLPPSVPELYRQGTVTVSDHGEIRAAQPDELRYVLGEPPEFLRENWRKPEVYHIVLDDDMYEDNVYHALQLEATPLVCRRACEENPASHVIYACRLPGPGSVTGTYEETAFIIDRKGGIRLIPLTESDVLPF